MTIRTSRTSEDARVHIDPEKCTSCGLCATVCAGVCLECADGKTAALVASPFGCIGCGHCAAICPTEAITVEGRCLSPEDIIGLPSRGARADYGSLYALMLARRSIRNFEEREVGEDVVRKIIDAAAAAPMGIPPSDVRAFVIRGKDKVRAFSFDLLEEAEKMMWFFSRPMLLLMRPFVGRDFVQMAEEFIRPLFEELIRQKKAGQDFLLYDAPLAIYFHGPAHGDPADATIAATYASLAGDSLGLGHCFIGSVAPVIMRSDRPFRQKCGLETAGNGIMVIFGYPRYAFRHAIRRTLADVKAVF